MADEILNPLLSLIKEQSLIDDLQFEEVVAEHKRAGTPVIQVLQDFGIMDLDTILQLEANHLGRAGRFAGDTNFSPELLKTSRPTPRAHVSLHAGGAVRFHAASRL
jgi:hypothetical protein